MGDERKIVPNNVGQGYIARRLIRRAVRFGKQLEISQKNWMTNISEIIINDYKNVYLELNKNFDFITKELAKEEERFEKTLNRGLKVIEKMATINGKEAFLLYETYGFPLEVLEEIRQVDSREDFFEELKKHQELSRTASAGMFKGGLADDKPETIKLHTAHHLLLAALQEVFGKNVKQRGSNINSQRLRLDFSIDRKLTDEEKNKIEDIVNRKIKEDLDIIKREMPIEEAKKIGAEMEFGVKYGNTVSVYFIEDKEGNVFSKEFCGGPHVKKTSELGKFEIIKEEASSQGVRRIKAVIK
jgi:alanyl-tRNA synthetase